MQKSRKFTFSRLESVCFWSYGGSEKDGANHFSRCGRFFVLAAGDATLLEDRGAPTTRPLAKFSQTRGPRSGSRDPAAARGCPPRGWRARAARLACAARGDAGVAAVPARRRAFAAGPRGRYPAAGDFFSLTRAEHGVHVWFVQSEGRRRTRARACSPATVAREAAVARARTWLNGIREVVAMREVRRRGHR